MLPACVPPLYACETARGRGVKLESRFFLPGAFARAKGALFHHPVSRRIASQRAEKDKRWYCEGGGRGGFFIFGLEVDGTEQSRPRRGITL